MYSSSTPGSNFFYTMLEYQSLLLPPSHCAFCRTPPKCSVVANARSRPSSTPGYSRTSTPVAIDATMIACTAMAIAGVSHGALQGARYSYNRHASARTQTSKCRSDKEESVGLKVIVFTRGCPLLCPLLCSPTFPFCQRRHTTQRVALSRHLKT